MARERIIMAAPTAAESVVMLLKPRSRMVVPLLALSMATDQPVVMTAMRMGQKRARTLTGRNPTRMNPSSSRAKRIPEVRGSRTMSAAMMRVKETMSFTPALRLLK